MQYPSTVQVFHALKASGVIGSCDTANDAPRKTAEMTAIASAVAPKNELFGGEACLGMDVL